MVATFSANAQKNIKKATLLTIENKKIEGIIDDRESFNTPQAILFKQNGADDFKLVKPTEAISIKIENGNYYISKKISIDLISNPLLEVDFKIDSNIAQFKTETVFVIAEFLASNISVYSYKDEKVHLYIQKNSDFLIELIHRKYIIKNDYGRDEYEDNSFLNTLNYLLEDCSKISNKIQHLRFNKNYIISIAKDYVACTNSNSNYASLRKESKINFGILAGANKGLLRVKPAPSASSGNGQIYNETFNASPSILLGARLQYYIKSGRQNKLSLIGDLYYTSLNANLDKQIAYSSPSFYSNRKVEYDCSFLKADILGRYAFLPFNKLSPIINVGISGIALLKAEGTSTDTEFLNGSSTSYSRALLDEQSGKSKKIIISPTAGIGLSYKKFSLEYRYWYTGSINYKLNYAITIGMHSIMMHYQLK